MKSSHEVVNVRAVQHEHLFVLTLIAGWLVCLSHDQIKRPNSSPALFQPLECLQERWIRLRSNWLPDWDSATVCEHHRAAFRGVIHSLALMTDRETNDIIHPYSRLSLGGNIVLGIKCHFCSSTSGFFCFYILYLVKLVFSLLFILTFILLWMDGF